MKNWSSWKDKKKELLEELNKARSHIIKVELVEARDIIQTIFEDMDYFIKAIE